MAAGVAVEFSLLLQAKRLTRSRPRQKLGFYNSSHFRAKMLFYYLFFNKENCLFVLEL